MCVTACDTQQNMQKHACVLHLHVHPFKISHTSMLQIGKHFTQSEISHTHVLKIDMHLSHLALYKYFQVMQ